MPIPFLSSIGLNKNEVQDFKVFNLASDPTLTSGGDYGYFWLNTSGTKTLKFWDGASIRSLIDSTTISSSTAGTANDLSGGVAGSLPYQQGVGDTTFLGIGSSGYILTSTGSAPQWSASIPSSSVSGLAASATTDTTNASNISSGTLGLARLSLASGQFYVGDGSNNPAATAKSSIPLSGFGAAGADVAMGGFKITGLADPSAATDAATRGYVDSVAQGLDVKASCLVATTADITLASPGAVTIDGIYSATDFTAGTTRILVKDQSAAAENGIYIWQGPSSAMTRSSDANTWDELVGAFTFVERGTANADSGWVCTVNAGGTLGSTAVTWVKFSQAGSYTAGNGIVQSGTSFNFAQSSAYTAGQIPFASSTTAMGFNANLHWDNSNNRLGIGTATPLSTITAQTQASSRLSFRTTDTVFGTVVGGTALDSLNGNDTALAPLGLRGSTVTIGSSAGIGLSIASDGVCTWSNVVNAGTAMTLNGTGLGIGVVPTVGKFEANIENGGSNGAFFRTTTYTYLNIVGTSAGGATGGSQIHLITTGLKDWIIGQRTDTVYSSANSFFIRDNGAGATRLTIDSSGNVGIGTQTPGKRLTVADASPTIRLNDTNTSVAGGVFGTIDWLSQDSSMPGGLAAKIDVYDDLGGYGDRGAIRFFTNNGTSLGERMVLTSSGNLGLGVTPKTWGSAYKALQINTTGAVTSYSGAVILGNNYYANSSGNPAYITAAAAGAYAIVGKAHTWYRSTDATPVADGACTLDPAMTLDASGNLLLGTASGGSARRLTVYGNSINTTATSIALQTSSTGTTSTDGLTLEVDGINGYLYNYENAPIFIGTNNTTRLSIKSTGQARFVPLASAPASPEAGDVYYDSTTNRLRYYNNTAWVDSGTRKFSGALAGTGTSFTVTHNLGTRDVTVAVRKSGSTYDQVFTDVQMTDTNTVTIVFASSVTGSDYTVTVIG